MLKITFVNRTSQILHNFAESQTRTISPFYRQLIARIKDEEVMNEIAQHLRAQQPLANMLLASIHFMAMSHPREELSSYYPSVNTDASGIPEAAVVLDFCRRYQSELEELMRTRIVQTNAINRCAYIFLVLAALKPEQPLCLLDIGASAGLNLQLDRFQFSYNGRKVYGDSEVGIESEYEPPVGSAPFQLPPIARRIAVDQHPVDLTDPLEVRWLKALIWPDQQARMKRMEAAINLAAINPVEWHTASRTADFEKIIRGIPDDCHLFVYHTHVLYQFTREERLEFRNLIDAIGKERPLTFLGAEAAEVFDDESVANEGVLVSLTEYRNGRSKQRYLYRTNGHANWMSDF